MKKNADLIHAFETGDDIIVSHRILTIIARQMRCALHLHIY